MSDAGFGRQAEPSRRPLAGQHAAWAVADDYGGRNAAGGLREGFLDPLEPFHPPAETGIGIESVDDMTADMKRVKPRDWRRHAKPGGSRRS